MAIRQLSPEQARTLIDRMLADLARMVAMVSQILDSVRLERGRVALKREPLELAGAVARVVGQFEERARQERIEIATDIQRGVEVLADPLALDVVVRNLLENALAAVARGRRHDRPRGAPARMAKSSSPCATAASAFSLAIDALLFRKFSRLHPARGGIPGHGARPLSS